MILMVWHLTTRWLRTNPLTIEDHEVINNYISMFPLLRGLHISTPLLSSLDSPKWDLNFLCERHSQYEALTELRITQLFAASMLPKIFFLPNLQTLQVTALDARGIESWSLTSGVRPRSSAVTHLFLTAILTPALLLQLLNWPAVLRSLVYNHEGYHIACAQAPTVSTFRTALQPFRRTLTTLKIFISDSYFISADAIDKELETSPPDSQTPYLDTSFFHSLRDLQIPSVFLIGLPGKEYTRDHILTLLPSSLQSLEINFGSQDLFLFHKWHLYYSNALGHDYTHDRLDKHGWLHALSWQCCEKGQFPFLKSVVVRDFGRTISWHPAYNLALRFARNGVQLHVALSVSPMNIDEDDERYSRRSEQWAEGPWFDGDPIFGQEPTEHSSSVQGTELEELEEDHEQDMLCMEDWEGFDAMMAGERERVNESWVRGQWPEYEDSREERNEMFRYGVRNGVYESG